MEWSRFLNDPALRGWTATAHEGCHILARPGCAALVVRSAAHEQGAAEWISGGRAPHPIIPLEDGGRAVVRRYLRGGAMRHLNHDRYFLGHRAFAEALATERVRTAGVNAPEVLAAAECRTGALGYTARLATRWIAHGREGAAWLQDAAPAARGAVLTLAGRQIARMHAAGVAHPDLNLRNLLIVEPPGATAPVVHLLDFDRARLYPVAVPARRRARDLERLGRSARKLGLALEERGGWGALREGYGAGWPLPARG
jgi:3-deoxy-D-manno-octulosonic acid kinase